MILLRGYKDKAEEEEKVFANYIYDKKVTI